MELTLSDQFQNYQAYGITITSNLPLESWLKISDQPGNLIVEGFPVSEDLFVPDTPPIFTSAVSDHLGRPISNLYRLGETLYLRISFAGGFFIDQATIRVQFQTRTDLVIVCATLLSYALMLWLEQCQTRCVHASGIVHQGKAAVFMADSTMGKSTLAATLLQSGAELLSDDIVPIMETPLGFLACPGYPSIRLSDEQTLRFLGGQANLAHWFPTLGKALIPIGVGGWGAYCNTSQKLQRLYVLERNPDSRSGEILFEPFSKTDAIATMIRFSFGKRILLTLGMAAERMAFFARLIEQISVVRLIYPSGYEHLAEVVRRVFQDMDETELI